jgi:NAD(P)-dependent dehydrogenase (short-subunit alcohol dehydrogenase family)/aryl carrier-like protein
VEGASEASWRREQLIDRLARELLSPTQDAVVAYRGVDRWVQDVAPAHLGAVDGSASPVREGGVYLITGGLGGLGLQVAEHLARLKPVKLVLTSRSGLPPRDAWANWLREREEADPVRRKIRKVLAMEALGADVAVRAVDVTDRPAMRVLFDEVQAQWGAFEGIIHAAGVVDDDLLPLKDAKAAARVLAPKVEGTLVLDEVLDDDGGESLDFFVLFSSVSALAGLPGQVDYTAANAFLDAFAQRKQALQGVPAISVGWGAWQEVGMAAEIAADGEDVARDGTPAIHPLFDRRRTDDEMVFESTLAGPNHWVLDGHRNSQGVAIMPGTGYLELARAAFAEVFGYEAVTLRDVYFISPLEIQGGMRRRLRIRLEPDAEGAAFIIESQPVGNSTANWDEHAMGQLASLPDASYDREGNDLEAIAARCTRHIVTFGPGDRTRQETHLQFGARWRCLREVRMGDEEALARLELSDVFASDLEHYALHPALLDMATGVGLPLVDGYEALDGFYVPMSYDALQLYRPLPSCLYSHVRCVDPAEADMPSFNVTLITAAGKVVAEITRFAMRRVTAETLDSVSYQVEPPAPKMADSLSLDLSLGLKPEEGVMAFDRILAGRELPHVLVSPVDMERWLHHIQEQTHPRERESTGEEQAQDKVYEDSDSQARRTFENPELKDGTEAAIYRMWTEMLGVDQLDRQDNFFAAGGSSLLLMRMKARIQRQLNANVPVEALFEEPTISGMAAAIETRSHEENGVPEITRVERKAFSRSQSPADR